MRIQTKQSIWNSNFNLSLPAFKSNLDVHVTTEENYERNWVTAPNKIKENTKNQLGFVDESDQKQFIFLLFWTALPSTLVIQKTRRLMTRRLPMLDCSTECQPYQLCHQNNIVLCPKYYVKGYHYQAESAKNVNGLSLCTLF